MKIKSGYNDRMVKIPSRPYGIPSGSKGLNVTGGAFRGHPVRRAPTPSRASSGPAPRRVTPAFSSSESESESQSLESRGSRESLGREGGAHGDDDIGDLDAFMNMSKKIPGSGAEAGGEDDMSVSSAEKIPKAAVPEPPGAAGGFPENKYTNDEEERKDLLNKLRRLKAKGFSVGTFSETTPLSSLRSEYDSLKYNAEMDQGVRFYQKMLIATVSGIEFVNKKYNPVDIELDGWSESFMDEIDSYNGILERLYAKYNQKINVPPEMELLMAIVGSGLLFHLSNKIFKKSSIADIAKNNPNMFQAMMTSMAGLQKEAPSAPPPPPPAAENKREMRPPQVNLATMGLAGMGTGVFGISPNLPPVPVSQVPETSREPARDLGKRAREIESSSEDLDFSEADSMASSQLEKTVRVFGKKTRKKAADDAKTVDIF